MQQELKATGPWLKSGGVVVSMVMVVVVEQIWCFPCLALGVTGRGGGGVRRHVRAVMGGVVVVRGAQPLLRPW